MTPPDLQSALFHFERDLYPDLKCIPMAVRFKLDQVGIKVTLTAWNRLSLATRKQMLTEWPLDQEEQRTAFREWLLNWLRTTSTHPPRELVIENALWDDLNRVPDAVAELSAECDPPISLSEWSRLTLLQRVALVKLARSAHEKARLPAALDEFRGNLTRPPSASE